MCFLTFASQLEIFTLGVITKKGPDFLNFLLRSKMGNLKRTQEVNMKKLEQRFHAMDITGTGVVTQEEASHFLAKWRHKDFIETVMNVVDTFVNVTGNMMNLAFMVVFVALFKAITLFTHRFSTRLVAISVKQ